MVLYLTLRELRRGRRHHDEIAGSASQFTLNPTDVRSKSSPNPVAIDRSAEMPTDGVRNARWLRYVAKMGAQRQRPRAMPSGLSERGELRRAPNSPDHAEMRSRPLLRRLFNTALPARVRIRSRNPCFFLRLRLLGWNVRFTSAS